MRNGTIARLAAVLLFLVLLCAASAALADTTVTLSDRVDYDAGWTTISWDVAGDELDEYDVYIKAINNGSATQTTFYCGDTKNHSLKADNMIPGKSYTVYVTDSEGRIYDSRDYEMAEPTVFVDGKLKNTSIKISVEPRRLKKGDPAKKAGKLSQFKASEIEKGIDEDAYYYGLKYSMKMPQLGHERVFFLTLAFESPDGYLMVVSAENMTYEYVARGYQTIWYYILGTNYFPNMLKTTGGIETGKYKAIMFLDGMWVNDTNFVVK